ncbi:MAG TPA: hypothetical protein VFY10_06595 [Dehalococcoidia bacterium]|nr:hypothetical protein [Dehalococcoidia bacterium]
MSSVSTSISVEASSPTVRLTYRATIRQSDGSPLSGREVTFNLDGDGSLQPRHHAKSLIRETDADGTAEVTWFRRTIFGRHLNAMLSVEVPDGCRADLQLSASLPAMA